MLSANHFLLLSFCLFSIGILGILLNKKNLILILMCIELMLLSVNTNFIVFAKFNNNVLGEFFAFFVLTVAACKVAVGLSIITLLFRKKVDVNVSLLRDLKG